MITRPIETLTMSAADLASQHPPVMRDRNKRVVFEVACPQGSMHYGEVRYARWAAEALPHFVDMAAATTAVRVSPSIYTYPAPEDGSTHWHVNFADPRLFFAYGGPLFAQDEMQVAEHPALASLREALIARKLPALTEEDGMPTPVTVMGVERRCEVCIDVNPAEGRPRGLYGNEFAAASAETVRRATRRLDPATASNILAIAAPSHGVGEYAADEIERILITAYTGFSAVVRETRADEPQASVVVHSGFWGCGAFGGNRVLMVALQVLAARVAGVDELALHTVDEDRLVYAYDALALVDRLGGAGLVSVDALVQSLVAEQFRWGLGNGT